MSPSYTTLLILKTMLTSSTDKKWYGWSLWREAQCGGGSWATYPVLHKLERCGWLTSHHEIASPNPINGRRDYVEPKMRRVYTLTEFGKERAIAALTAVQCSSLCS